MTTPIAQGPVDVNVRQDFKDLEQAAFEKWLWDRCPSGDVEAVQRQWLESYEYAELLDEQEPEWQNDVQAAAGGLTQTALEW